MNSNPVITRFNKSHIYLLALTIIIAVSIGVYFLNSYSEKSLRKDKNNELKSIAELKINQIVAWKKERIGDARVFSGLQIIKKSVEELKAGVLDNVRVKHLKQLLSNISRTYDYQNISITTLNGKVLFTLDDSSKNINYSTISAVKKTIDQNKVAFTSFYKIDGSNEVHFEIIAPVIASNNKPSGLLILTVNLNKFLFPLIQSWPTPSKTAETLIIRKDSNSVLFLNELRFRKNTALNFRIPLTRKEVPAVQAVLGYKGMWDGKDYRDVDVLSYMDSIPGTPWFMISKIDKSEIFSEMYVREFIIAIGTLLLFLLVTTGLFWLYHYRERNLFRNMYLVEKNFHTIEKEFRATLYSVGDGVISTDKDGNVKYMNNVAEQLTGWNESEAQGRKLSNVFKVINENTRLENENPVNKVLESGKIIGLANHSLLISRNGSEIPIADSGAPIRNDSGEIIGVVLVFRDQTKERNAQKLILDGMHKYQNLFNSIRDSILVADNNRKIINCNPAFIDLFGYSLSDIIGKETSYVYASPEEFKDVGNRIRNNIENQDFIITINYKKKNGEVFPGETNVFYLKNRDGEVSGFIGLIRDITERRQAEEALIASTTELKKAQEVAHLGNWIWHISSNRLEWSDEMYRIFGIDKNEFTGDLTEVIKKAIHPDDRAAVEKANLSVINDKTPTPVEYRVIHPDGKVRIVWAEAGELELDKSGKPEILRGIVQDITEEREAEEKYRSLFNNIQDFICLISTEGNIISLNSAFENISGWSIDEWLNKHFSGLIHPDDMDIATKSIQHILSEQKPYMVEVRLLCKSGEYKFVEVNPSLYKSGGVIIGSLGIIRDITDRKKIELKLQQSENRFRGILENVNLFAVILNHEGKIQFCNNFLLKQTGYKQNEVLGESWMDLFIPDDIKSEINNVFNNVLSEEKHAYHYQNDILMKNGERKTIAWNNTVLYDVNHHITGIASMGEDISAREKAERNLQESEMKYRSLFENMTSGFALHEIITDQNNNPVDYKFLEMNGEFTRLTGIKRDAIGKTVREILPGIEKDTANWISKYGKVALQGAHFRFEEFSESLKKWFKILAYQPEERKFATIFEDITDKKLMEETLRNSEENMRYIIKHDPNAIAVYDNNLNYIAVSDRYLKDYNVKEESVIGKHHYEVFPEIPERWRQVHKRCLAGAIERNDDDFFERPDGSITYNSWECRPWRTIEGEIGGIITYTEVTTERKKIELALKESEEKYRTIVENMNDAIYSINPDGVITYVTKSIENILGYRSEEIIGKHFYELIHPDDLHRIYQTFEEIKLQEIEPEEFKMIKKSGEECYVRTSSKGIYEDSEFLGLNGILTDITAQTRARIALKESEEKYRKLVELSPDAIFIHQGGLIKFMNAETVKMFEANNKNELYNKDVMSLVHPDSKNNVKARIKSLEDGADLIPAREQKLITLKGKIFYAEVKGVPITLYGDKLIQVVARDISDRKIVEKKLRESEALLKATGKMAKVGGWELEADTNKVIWSEETYNIHELPIDQEPPLETAINYFHPDDRPVLQEAIKNAFEKAEPYDLTLRFTSAKGKKLITHTLCEPIVENGKVVKLFGTFQDVTERKKAEIALRESEEKYRTLITQSPDGIFVVDLKGNFQSVNKVMWERFNLTEEKMLSMNIWDFIPAKYRSQFETRLKRIIDGKSLTEAIEYEVSVLEGKTLYVEVLSAPYYKENTLVGFQGIARDVTERKNVEKEIIKSRKQLENLYKNLNEVRENERTGISRELHDELGQSLTAFKMDLNWVKSRIGDRKDLIDKTKVMVGLVDDMIKNVQRISSDLRPGILDDLGLIPAIEWYTQEFKNRTDINCEIELNEIPLLEAKAQLALFRILQEGLTNISRHAQAKNVRVKLYSDSNNVFLDINDDGIGITEDQINAVNSLGLIGIRERVRQFNGSFVVNSEINKGTNLFISIPVISNRK